MLEVNVAGAAALEAELKAMGARAVNLEPVLSGRAEALRSTIVSEVFGRAQSPSGEPWEPLQKATIRSKGSSAPLIDTGTLRGSIVASASDSAITFGVSGPAERYAGTHQFGTRTVPARPFLPVTDEDFQTGPIGAWWERLRERVLAYVKDGTR